MRVFCQCGISVCTRDEAEVQIQNRKKQNLLTFYWSSEIERSDKEELSQEEWKNFLARVEAGLYSDFFDASITVEFVHERGSVSHSHINPVFLERYEPGKDDDDCDLLMAASWLITGKGSLDWFTHCYDVYKEKCQKAKEKEK